jgi:hypothetical protein
MTEACLNGMADERLAIARKLRIVRQERPLYAARPYQWPFALMRGAAIARGIGSAGTYHAI